MQLHSGEATFYEGTITNNYGTGILVGSTTVDYAPTVTIYGTEITSEGTGINCYGTGTVTLNSSTTYGSPKIASSRHAVANQNSGTINVYAGTLTSSVSCVRNYLTGRINIGTSSSTSSTSPSLTGTFGAINGANIAGEASGTLYIYSGKITGTTEQGVYSDSTGNVYIGSSISTSSTAPNITGAKNGLYMASTAGYAYVYSGRVTGNDGAGVSSDSAKSIVVGSSTSTSSTVPTITGSTYGVYGKSTDSTVYIYARSGKIVGKSKAGIYLASTTDARVVIGNTTNTSTTTTSSTSTTKSLAVSPTISGYTYGVQLSSSSLKLGTFNSGNIQGITAATNATLGTIRSGYTTASTTVTYSTDAVIESGTYKRTYIKAST